MLTVEHNVGNDGHGTTLHVFLKGIGLGQIHGVELLVTFLLSITELTIAVHIFFHGA